jgi:hypothetical protein
LTSLVKKLDEATAKHADDELGSFIVVLSDDQEATAKKLKELARKDKIKRTILTVFDAAGPEDYNLAKEADVTVLLYVNREVKANFAFKKGDLTEKAVEKIVADLPKILPATK